MTEFGLIEYVAKLFGDVERQGWEAIGDDCTVLPIGGDEVLVITTDMLQEDVHFLRSATSARELGRKSLAVNLSDVAAMGVKPVATLLSMALPAELTEEWAKEFLDGFHSLAKEHDVALVGGDTTSSKISVFTWSFSASTFFIASIILASSPPDATLLIGFSASPALADI